MDWLSFHRIDELHAEWQAIVDRAAPECRIIWRIAGLRVPFVDPIQVQTRGRTASVGELLQSNASVARQLHDRDRVNTYGSLYIADLVAA